MNLLRKLGWYILRVFGLKQASWDRQYLAGLWDRGRRSPHTLSRVIALCRGGRLVEFGCGSGDLPHRLPRESFSTYLGIDISAVAIERAVEKAGKAGLTGCQFQQGDMARWPGTSETALILAEECLYYLNAHEVQAFLERCCQSLTSDGVILVIVHDGRKHASTLDVCRRVCRVFKEETVESRVYLTLQKN